MAASQPKKAVLFVCLGNICRSPMAEAVFNQVLHERDMTSQWRVDSAAIGDWHRGSPPDHRARSVAASHGMRMQHAARQIMRKDFDEFDWVFGMDESNITDLQSMAPAKYKAQIELLGKYDPQGELIIEDPYYDKGDEGFKKCYEQCVRCCTGFLDMVAK